MSRMSFLDRLSSVLLVAILSVDVAGLQAQLRATNPAQQRGIGTNTNHIGTQITEIMAGANGDSTVQFIQMGFGGCGQNIWKGFGSASAAILVFFDAAGNETFRYKFPNDPPCGNDHVLIATQGFVTLTGLTPEFIIPAKVSPISGKVCFKGNTTEAGSGAFFRNHCVSYGSFTGNTETNVDGFGFSTPAGSPAPAIPIVGTTALKLTGSPATETNAQFTLVTADPENHLDQTVTVPVLSQVVVGQNLFNKETFGGNGRTCASCHVASLGLGLTPSNIQSRFATLATGGVNDFSDPLFLGESNMNLNTLIVTSPISDNSQGAGRGVRDFEGIITGSGGGRARIVTKLIAQGSSTIRYLVYGGLSPALSGTISDSLGNSAALSSITAGNLACGVGVPTCTNQLENPTKMRTSVDGTNFPQGRGLILENIDGFTNPHTSNHVFRKSPNLDNAKLTAPFGLSGLVGGATTLGEFAAGAVKQHFPRTINRVEGVDFRLPTTDEKAAMNAFQQTVNVPANENFNLDLFATTAAQIAGRTAFFSSTAKCSKCHSGSVLANTDGTIAGKPGNANFDTNVDGMPINAGGDLLPNEASGTREFNTPALFNVRNHSPFFHNGAAATVKQAVEFYTSPAFQSSPAVAEIGGLVTIANVTELDNIVAFLEGLAVRPYSLTGPLFFGVQDVNAGATASQLVTITNTSASPITLTSPFARLAGTHSSEFVITSNNLTGSLGVGASAQVGVAFDPTTSGAKSAILEVLAGIPSGVNLSGGTAAPPTLSINDITVTEGNAGTVNANFTVALSPASAFPVTVNFATADGTASTTGGSSSTFSNSTAITIPDSGDATPYPSNVTVSGTTGTITKVTATLTGFTHTFPADVDVLLVGPGGQNVMLMSDVGGGGDLSNVTVTFDDAAASSLTSSSFGSGTFQPTNIGSGDTFSPPAPASGFGSALAGFNNTSANGTWSLFVVDGAGGDSGSFSGGFTLAITTTGGGGDYVANSGQLTFSPGVTSQPVSVTVNGDVTVEPAETFFVNLSSPGGATILDSQGQGTITNDDGSAPPAPTNTVATATSSTSVGITWTASPGATSYRVYRSSGGAFTLVGSPSGTSFSDNPVSSNTAFLYKVRAFATAESGDSNADLATTFVFTDPALVGGTTVKLAHFTGLLTAVNAVRALGSLAPVTFTAPTPTTSVTVRRQHLLDLRAGLDGARNALLLNKNATLLTPLTYTDSTVNAGSTTIKAVHITDLRNGMN